MKTAPSNETSFDPNSKEIAPLHEPSLTRSLTAIRNIFYRYTKHQCAPFYRWMKHLRRTQVFETIHEFAAVICFNNLNNKQSAVVFGMV